MLADRFRVSKNGIVKTLRSRFVGAWPFLLLILSVVTVFWKLALTKQYTFLESPDSAYAVVPWLNAQIFAIRHWSVLLWDPYEWFGQSLIGQVQPGVASPFTFLLALAPLHNGHIQLFYVHIWFVLIHCCAAIFAYLFFRDLGCAKGPAILGGTFYATAGFCGNTNWPGILAAGIWAPLVFLFLLRCVRGKAPLKSAACSGAALGFSWLSGHHGPALILTLATFGMAAGFAFRSRVHRGAALLRVGVLIAVTALVSAVQVIPAIEYGKLALRWTSSGVLAWNDKVEFPEHVSNAMHPPDLLDIVMPRGSGLYTDPFVGTVGLSLAAAALLGSFRKIEVRLFLLLSICALLYALAGNDVLYGPLYALVPLVEKSRSPIMALSLFHFSVSALVALGADLLVSSADSPRASGIPKALVWFGGGIFGLFTLAAYLRPTVTSAVLEGDPRPGMIGLIALLLAGVYYAWNRRYLRREQTLAFLGLLLIVEQGNEVGWNWSHARDPNQMVFLRPLSDTQDLGDFLGSRPSPKRVDVNTKDLAFNFGDWYRIDTINAYLPSMLAQTAHLEWWSDRVSNMYGTNYTVSRTAMHSGALEVFAGKSGIKIFANPEAFPRAWTVHQILSAPDTPSEVTMVRDGSFDLTSTALSVGPKPELEQCNEPDKILSIDEQPAMVRVNATMACKGLLIVSDNWYPGWRAEIDGKPEPILKVNTAIRGVVVGGGRHEVVMKYQPGSVYFGLLCTVLGLAGTVIFCFRQEMNGPDLNPASE